MNKLQPITDRNDPDYDGPFTQGQALQDVGPGPDFTQPVAEPLTVPRDPWATGL